MVSGIARLGKLAGYNWPTDCFNRLFDCSTRVSRSFCNLDGKAQQAFGRAWAMPGQPLAAPLHVVDSQTHFVAKYLTYSNVKYGSFCCVLILSLNIYLLV